MIQRHVHGIQRRAVPCVLRTLQDHSEALPLPSPYATLRPLDPCSSMPGQIAQTKPQTGLHAHQKYSDWLQPSILTCDQAQRLAAVPIPICVAVHARTRLDIHLRAAATIRQHELHSSVISVTALHAPLLQADKQVSLRAFDERNAIEPACRPIPVLVPPSGSYTKCKLGEISPCRCVHVLRCICETSNELHLCEGPWARGREGAEGGCGAREASKGLHDRNCVI